jgi:hypothetical protein
MPVYEVQTDSGTYQIEAANEQALASAVGELPKASETSFSGIAKSAGAGLVEGLAGLAGLPADALDLVARGSDALLGTKAGDESGPIAQRFGSQAMQKRVEGATGPLYKSQGGVEELARTAGSFLPGLVGGAASLPVKLGTRVGLPAVAAEGAKALTEGTSLEPYAPIAGALGGLAGGMGIERALTRGTGVAARPTRAQIDNETNALYNRPELGQVRIHGNEATRFVDQTQVGIDRGSIAGMRGPVPAHDADRTFRVLDRLRNPGVGAGPHEVRIADIDSVRKILGEYAGEVGPNFRPTPNARAAMSARGAIDDFLANLNQSQLSAGNAQTASAILREARASAQAGFKIAKVERILEQARNTAAATHSGGNLENEIYKKVRTYLNNPEKHLRGWTRDEITALRRVLPSLAESVLRRGGKLLGGGGGLGQLASGSAGGAMFGFPGMVALPAAGMGMNRAGSALAARRMNNLMDTLASGAPSYAPHRAAYQASLQGPGILGRLPSPAQGSLYAALMAQRPQPVQ